MIDRAASLAAFVRALSQRYRDEIEARWPKVLRRVGGYNLDIYDNQSERPYTPDGSVNLAHLLIGSEGTLAYTKNLTLKLAPLPASKVLGVVNFPSFQAAMRAPEHIVQLGPKRRGTGRSHHDRPEPGQPRLFLDDPERIGRQTGRDPARGILRR
jgi:hypothetical protein